MKSNRMVRAAIISGALLCLSTTMSWAGCDSRPATPTGLRAAFGNDGAKSILLIWTNRVTRTGLTYFDIYVRGPNNQNLGMDITGGAAQQSVAGQIGQMSFHNLPNSTEYNFAMRARTAPGTGGCVSGQTSEWVKVSRMTMK